MSRQFIKAVAVTFLIEAAVVGGVGAAASPICRTWVMQKLTQPIHKHHSKATLEKWKQWNEAHPNYHLPKREILRRYDIACKAEKPLDTFDMALDLTLQPVDTPEYLADATEVEVPTDIPTIDTVQTDVDLVATNDGYPIWYPPIFFWGGTPSMPVAPIQPVGPIAPTPEPASIFLLITGLGGLACKKFYH